MSRQDVPARVNIRTDNGNERRFDAIEQVAAVYGKNRSDAVADACEDVRRFVEGAEEVLRRDDLTLEQRRDIAESLSTYATRFDVVDDVEVDRDP